MFTSVKKTHLVICYCEVLFARQWAIPKMLDCTYKEKL